MRLRRAVDTCQRAGTRNLTGAGGRGRHYQGVRTKRVDARRRMRALGKQGRPQRMPDLSCELFQWWIDMAETLQARVPSSDIIAQAKVIIADAERYVQQCCANGQLVPKAQHPAT